jgi:serine/threonine protein kinase
VKLADFGLSKFGKRLRTSTQIKFQPKFSAPEVWYGGEITPKADIWSLAIIMWQVFTQGTGPYLSQTDIERGERLRQPPECPDALYGIY